MTDSSFGDSDVLTGTTNRHLCLLENTPYYFHRSALGPFLDMHKSAMEAGFNLHVCSSFRDFSSQLNIWNAKATGKRPLRDRNGRELNFEVLSGEEVMFSILRWSALPGASRHHWGTDLDVYDRNAIPKDYTIKLIPDEFEGTGIFAPAHNWLDTNMARFGFFRPYAQDRGGVNPERWHISFEPVAQVLYAKLDKELIRKVLKPSDIELKDEILKNLDIIFQRYVRNISLPGVL